jgi:hypothetical protein
MGSGVTGNRKRDGVTKSSRDVGERYTEMGDGKANPSAAGFRFHHESPDTGNNGDIARGTRVNRPGNFANAPACREHVRPGRNLAYQGRRAQREVET